MSGSGCGICSRLVWSFLFVAVLEFLGFLTTWKERNLSGIREGGCYFLTVEPAVVDTHRRHEEVVVMFSSSFGGFCHRASRP